MTVKETVTDELVDQGIGKISRKFSEIVQRVAKSSMPGLRVQELLQELIDFPFGAEYPIEVDYTKTLKEMMDAGKYLVSDFPFTQDDYAASGKGLVKLGAILMPYTPHDIAGMNFIFESMSIRPGCLAELLALGSKYPYLPMEFYIFATGTQKVGRSPALFRFGGKYGLGDRYLDSAFPDGCGGYSLAFRKG